MRSCIIYVIAFAALIWAAVVFLPDNKMKVGTIIVFATIIIIKLNALLATKWPDIRHHWEYVVFLIIPPIILLAVLVLKALTLLANLFVPEAHLSNFSASVPLLAIIAGLAFLVINLFNEMEKMKLPLK